MADHPSGDVEVLTPRSPAGGVGGASFAQHGVPAAPGCCLWCGRKLRLSSASSNEGIVARDPSAVGSRGDYGDNAFCGLRCGYLFGVRLAVLGRRLQATPAVPVPSP